MTVGEAVEMLTYGTNYEIRGAFSGKTYHKSYLNTHKNFDKYANNEVIDTPYGVDFRVRGSDCNRWCEASVVIWMADYDISVGKAESEVDEWQK